jgi:hypothetical protein
MSDESNKSFLDRVRAVRDSTMEDLARVTLAWTSSDTFQTINAAISKPALLTTAVLRRATESAMADVLARLNLPSREDVLALSQRLTRIELVLDDLGSGMDQLRRASSRQQRPAARERDTNGDGRSSTSPVVKEG